MSKLTMCQGLVASGKSTWASTQNAVVVNKDDIRLQLQEDCGWHWSREGEKLVVEIRDAKIQLALAAGKDVISSDTNFGGGHEARLRQLAAEGGATFEVKRFDVPLAECLRRNAQRDAAVPDNAIIKMYEQNIQDNPRDWPLSADTPPVRIRSNVERIEGLPDAIICDLDGTLCIHNGRGPFDYQKCDTDLVNLPVLRVIEAMDTHYSIIFMSGREDSCREKTLQWIEDQGLEPYMLYMRQTGDRRKDSIVKRELFDTHVRGKWNVEFVLDDRDQVVRMWRELGLKCFQVAEGNF